MRDAGQTLLPQHEEEGDVAYAERLENDVLFNLSELTLESWVGRPFSDPVELSEDMPEQIRSLMDNIDLQGNQIDVFARNWFRDGLAKSFSHVLVEFPMVDQLDGERTMDDDLREGVRPYWVQVNPENLFFAHAMVIDGVEVLTHVRILEFVSHMEGFSEVIIPQIRVIDAGVPQENGSIAAEVSLYQQEDPKKDQSPWQLTGPPRALSVPFIPLITFYADRKGLMTGKPPIADLTDLNIRHWQSNSDQISVLTISRFPILAGSGVGGSDRVAIGPHTWLTTSDPNGRWYYVEHSGKAIQAGRQEMLDLTEAMMEYGAEFLKKRPSRETATARALDSAEATSPLQDATLRFMDALNTAIAMTGAWLGLNPKESGRAKITTDFGPEEASTQYLDAIKFARVNNDLSREMYLMELQRVGALPDGFDFEKNEQQLGEEAPAPVEPEPEPQEGEEEDEE